MRRRYPGAESACRPRRQIRTIDIRCSPEFRLPRLRVGASERSKTIAFGNGTSASAPAYMPEQHFGVSMNAIPAILICACLLLPAALLKEPATPSGNQTPLYDEIAAADSE